MNIDNIKNELQKYGYVEIKTNIFISTDRYILDNQEKYGLPYNFPIDDLSKHDFWLTINGHSKVNAHNIGFDSFDDTIAFIEKM